VDLSLRRSITQALEYFNFRLAGSDQKYPLESLPIYSALQGEPASADDIEADLGDRRVTLEIWASPVRDEAGNVESAVVAFQDITRRKQADAELAEYRIPRYWWRPDRRDQRHQRLVMPEKVHGPSTAWQTWHIL
jgi:hypothetical protein